MEMGSGGIAPCILTSSVGGGEWPASLTGHFTPGERAPATRYIGRRRGEFQSWSGLCGEDENFLPLPANEPRFPGRPAHSVVTILT
jgi:hypothetical protein